jgi:hypothetical protein
VSLLLMSTSHQCISAFLLAWNEDELPLEPSSETPSLSSVALCCLPLIKLVKSCYCCCDGAPPGALSGGGGGGRPTTTKFSDH